MLMNNKRSDPDPKFSKNWIQLHQNSRIKPGYESLIVYACICPVKLPLSLICVF